MPGSAANMPGDPGPRSMQEGLPQEYQRVPAADYPQKKGPRTPEEPLQAPAPRNPGCRRWLRCLQRLKSNKKTTAAVGLLLLFLLVTPLNVYVWFPFFRQGHHEKSCPVRPRCPDYSVHFKEKCYFLNKTREDWHASNDSCSLNNGSLAVFKTPKDLEFLVAAFAHAVPWIGLYKERGVYLWVDSQAFNESTFELVSREDCAYIDGTSITTTSCHLERASICMKKM